MFVASTQPLQHRASNEFLGVWVPAFAGTTAGSNKKPGPFTRAFRLLVAAARSGSGRKQLRRAGLDRLGGFGRDLLGQFGKLLGLRGQGFELLAGVRGPEFGRLR